VVEPASTRHFTQLFLAGWCNQFGHPWNSLQCYTSRLYAAWSGEPFALVWSVIFFVQSVPATAGRLSCNRMDTGNFCCLTYS